MAIEVQLTERDVYAALGPELARLTARVMALESLLGRAAGTMSPEQLQQAGLAAPPAAPERNGVAELVDLVPVAE